MITALGVRARRLIRTACLIFPLLLVVAAGAPAAGAPSKTKTKVSLNGKLVEGAAGRETLRGRLTVSTPGSWKRISGDGARIARFRSKSGSCSAEIQVSGRAVATRTDPGVRVRSVTRSPRAVIGQGRTRSRVWRVVHLKAGGGAYTQDLPRAYAQNPPDVYAIAALRLSRARFVDVRAFAWYRGCSTKQIRTGFATKALTTLVKTARVDAHIVRR